MLRAMAKGTLLFGIGNLPGGARLYRKLTREWLGTQATHVDKLERVLPGYLEVWRGRCGLKLDGLDLWVHEPGWTPFWGLASSLLTGRGAALTNVEATLQDRYLDRAVAGALGCALPAGLVPAGRRERIASLRGGGSARAALAGLGCRIHESVQPGCIPLPDASADLVHSGGALEHYPEAELEAFLGECRRILRPGGLASHVFDHRDHLRHADRRWPYLAHYAWPEPLYRRVFANPLLHHARLLPTEVAQRFERAGFEPVAVRRMILGGGYADEAAVLAAAPGLPRWLLEPARRGCSELDLRTAAAHYLFRKPLG